MTLFDPGPPAGPGDATAAAGTRRRRPRSVEEAAAPVAGAEGDAIEEGAARPAQTQVGAPAPVPGPPSPASGSTSSEAGSATGELPPAPPTTVRLRLEVAYDGAGFHGFAAQPGQPTVGGALRDAIATVARHRVELTCAGRTDTGVHALGQVVHVDVRPDLDLRRLVKSVNTLLGPAVVVRHAEPAPEGFDARHGARVRRYRYLVHVAEAPDPLLARLTWTVRAPLDLRPMRAGADALLGEHDFRAFCRRVPGTSAEDPIVRRVLATEWTEVPAAVVDLRPGERLLRFDIAANAFCHQMVRSIVGMLVEVGRGRRTAADVHWLLQAGDRSQAPDLAPPQGLCLVGVDY